MQKITARSCRMRMLLHVHNHGTNKSIALQVTKDGIHTVKVPLQHKNAYLFRVHASACLLKGLWCMVIFILPSCCHKTTNSTTNGRDKSSAWLQQRGILRICVGCAPRERRAMYSNSVLLRKWGVGCRIRGRNEQMDRAAALPDAEQCHLYSQMEFLVIAAKKHVNEDHTVR
jgi:hypothetical protein